MSRTKPTEVEYRELEFSCPKCHADAGEWCKVVVDKRNRVIELQFVGLRASLHGARFERATSLGRLPL